MKPRPVRIHIPDRELLTTRRKNVAYKVTCARCKAEVTVRSTREIRSALDGHPCVSAANPPAPAA